MPLNLFTLLERRFGDPTGGFSRRDLLMASLAAASGILVSSSHSRAAQGTAGKKIIIIGAGMAGVAAAYELQFLGYEVQVVEARDRLGGRAHTLDRFIKNKTVEAGGEMIGLNHPAWISYADQMGLTLLPIPHDAEAEMPIIMGNKRLEPAQAKALWKEMRASLTKINADAERVDAYAPWKSAGAKDLDRRDTADWIAKLAVPELVQQAMTVQLTAINGVVPAQQSYLANLAMVKGGGLDKYWTQTDEQHCDGGNQQLPEELSDRVGSHCFILNQPVKSIALDDKQATVTLADGRVLQGDDVILTAPVSTWGQIEFDPPLPAELKPQMGINTKFLTHVKTRFWEEDNQSPRSFSDGVIPLTWEDTGNQPEEGGVCLTVYGGGPTAKQASDWPDPDRQPNYLAALKALYPRIAANFLAGKFINWPQDRWALGSYSFPAPGQVTTLGPILYEGLGRLHFAGEHCCYAFIGYMEGALQSGGLLARRLAERDGLVKKK